MLQSYMIGLYTESHVEHKYYTIIIYQSIIYDSKKCYIKVTLLLYMHVEHKYIKV